MYYYIHIHILHIDNGSLTAGLQTWYNYDQEITKYFLLSSNNISNNIVKVLSCREEPCMTIITKLHSLTRLRCDDVTTLVTLSMTNYEKLWFNSCWQSWEGGGDSQFNYVHQGVPLKVSDGIWYQNHWTPSWQSGSQKLCPYQVVPHSGSCCL